MSQTRLLQSPVFHRVTLTLMGRSTRFWFDRGGPMFWARGGANYRQSTNSRVLNGRRLDSFSHSCRWRFISIRPGNPEFHQTCGNGLNAQLPYHLSQDAEVVVRIYDTKGRIARTLDMGFQSFGYYASRNKAAYWNGRTDSGEMVSSGTYFYQIQAGDYTETRKSVILK